MIDSISSSLGLKVSVSDVLKERAILLHVLETYICESHTHTQTLTVRVIYAMREAWETIYCGEPLK